MPKPFWMVLGLLAACGTSGSVVVVDAWAGTTPPGVDSAAFYVTIENGTADDLTLTTASSPRCASIEIHESTLDENQVMRMRPVTDLTISAGRRLEMEPGRTHVMCLEPATQLIEGERIDIEFRFQGGLTVNGQVAVENR